MGSKWCLDLILDIAVFIMAVFVLAIKAKLYALTNSKAFLVIGLGMLYIAFIRLAVLIWGPERTHSAEAVVVFWPLILAGSWIMLRDLRRFYKNERFWRLVKKEKGDDDGDPE